MSLFKNIHHNITEEVRILDEIESLMIERAEFQKNRFSIQEMEYNPDGSVEWNPEQAKPPGGGGGITRDTGAGLKRRREGAKTPKIADVVLTNDQRGQVVPAIITDMDQQNGIVQNKKVGLKQKVDLTTLRPAQGEVAKRFAVKYPDRTFWQAG